MTIKREEFIAAVKAGKFPFPFKRENYSPMEIKNKIKNFKKYSVHDRIVYKKFGIKKIVPFSVNAKKELVGAKRDVNNGFNFLGKTIIIESIPSDYEDFNVISDLFQEEQRLKAKVYSARISPWDLFHNNPEMVYDAAQNAVNAKKINAVDGVTRKDLREALWKISYEATSFRPTLMVSIIQMFKCKSVLDFCAGWGDRLIGAIGANAAYTGIDPNPNLQKGYQEIIKTYVPEESRRNYKVIQSRAELAIIPPCTIDPDGLYDCIFTSPPYFDLEEYIPPGAPGYNDQSIVVNKSEKSWFYNFLLPAIMNCYKHLKNLGTLAININQKTNKETYVSLMVNKILEYCPGSIYLGVICYANKSTHDAAQPIWIFKRKN